MMLMTWFKWFNFAVMLSGAVVTSLALNPILGIELLLAGNVMWLGTAVYSRDWPSAANFAMLATVWGIGAVKFYLG